MKKAHKTLTAIASLALAASLAASLAGCGGKAQDYVFEAEKAELSAACMVETGPEYSAEGSGPEATPVGYFATAGETITFKINASKDCSATLTLRASSACGQWAEPMVFEEVDMSKGEHAKLTVNGAECKLEGVLPGLEAPMDWEVVSSYYKNYGTATAKIDLKSGENVIVLTSQGYNGGQGGINVDKITINAASELTWTETDNSDRVPQQ